MNKYSFIQKNFPFFVVGCLVEKANKILLVKEGIIERGKWNQPAGWLDLGEDPIKGAIRETEEETGLKIKIKYLLGIYSLIKLGARTKGRSITNPHCLKLIFVAKIVGQNIQKLNKKEIIEKKFFSPKEILKMKNKELRDLDIKKEVKDYLAGKKYPLSIIHHFKYRVQY